MCRSVNCRTCGKTTWAGCGQHLNQVFAGVPKSQRCDGHQKPAGEGGGMGGWFRRVSGR